MQISVNKIKEKDVNLRDRVTGHEDTQHLQY